MGNRRNGSDVLGEFTNGRRNTCRRCFDQCEDAIEFVEAVKDLLDDFFDNDHCDCCKKHHCRRNND